MAYTDLEIEIFVMDDDFSRLKKAMKEMGKDSVVNMTDDNGCSPLFFTTSAEMTEFLLISGADPDVRNKWGETPLHEAYSADVAAVLIDAGANMDIRDRDGYTPLGKQRSYHNDEAEKIADLIESRIEIKESERFNTERKL